MEDIRDDADEAVWALARTFPQFSAHVVVTRKQIAVFAALFVALAALLIVTPRGLALGLAVAMAVSFVANVVFRTALIWIGAGIPAAPARVERIQDEDLPLYTILVPVYGEAHVLPALVAGLRALDYPVSKIEIRIVTEADDTKTVAVAKQLASGDSFSVIEVPACHPRTKPKACNFALPGARGEYLVIYDAEDKPEPDQLRKAVAAFRAAPRSLACLQARLAFHNAEASWIGAMGALDYELWFGFLLPGLSRLGVPMPLGGTSNHFRTSVLKEIKGWDPFNVTEDADLGIRLAQRGYRVATLDSTTFEEAASTLGNWTRQRSRWMKGYMQTWLVHMRNPARLVRHAGIAGFIAFQLFIGGAFFAALVNPVLWLLFCATRLFGVGMGFDAVSAPLDTIAIASLIGGNALFTYLMMLGALRRGWLHLVPCGLTAFGYWLLISAATYRGLWQLFFKPFFWEKTVHGTAPRAASVA